MQNWKNIIEPRGYPYKFNNLPDFNIPAWTNMAKRMGGEISFDFNTELLKQKGYNVKGLGQKWTDDAFEVWSDKITSVKTEWTTNPYYPGGESLGYKEFYNVYNETGNDIQATKATTFYKTMSSKGFLTIKVDIYPEKEEEINKIEEKILI